MSLDRPPTRPAALTTDGRPITEIRPLVEQPPPAETGVAPADYEPSTNEATERGLSEWLRGTWLLGLANWQWLLVAGVLVALLLTRYWDLGTRAMHHDESMHAKYAWDTYRGQVYKYNPLLHGPLQFFLPAASFILFGATEATARFAPATFGVALVLLTFFWRRLLGNVGWLFALALFTFSPSFTYYSRMLREDSYTATFTLMAAAGLVCYVYTRRRAWFYTATAGLALAFATKETTYITIFLFGTWAIAGLAYEWLARRRAQRGEGGGERREARRRRDAGTQGASDAASPVPASLRPHVAASSQPPAPATHHSSLITHHSPSPPPLTTAGLHLLRDKGGWWGMPVLWGGILLFAAIYLVLFTSLFTNPRGWMGARDGVLYWLAQHGVQRGNQPPYYYLMLLAVYETLPLAFGLAGIVRSLRRPTVFTTFLVWWFVGALIVYSWAGEKMPWLVIQIATPLVILAAWYLGEVLSDPARAGGLFHLLARGWHRAGQLVLGSAPAGGAELSRSTRGFALATFGLLFAWTLHTGWPVNFERPDVPQDMLVYTQTTPDVPKVVRDIEDLSRRETGDSKAIGISVTAGTWWPFSWYFRDFKNAEYPSQLTAPATRPVVLVAIDEDERNRAFLQGYTRTRYKMRWWYPEDYRQLKLQWFVDLVTRPDVRQATWKWLIYRDTLTPLGSYDFYVYVRQGAGGGATAAAEPGTPQPDVARAAQPPQRPDQAGAAGPGQQPPAAESLQSYAGQVVALSPVTRWGAAGNGSGQFREPRGAAVDAAGTLYVADTLNHRIERFDESGKLLIAWGTNGSGDGQFKEPMGVAVGPDGNVYVADTWNNRIQKFDPNGRFLAKWGTPGNAIGARAGEFYGPRALAFDGSGTLYVVDTGNKRIQKFDTSGKLLGQIGSGGAGAGQLNEPIGIAVSAQGEVFVADRDNRRVQRLSADGRPLTEWRISGWQAGVRNEPYVALDGDGNAYVTDPANHRLFKFSPDGDVLAVAGGFGTGPNQFNSPTGIAISPTSGNVFVVDTLNHRVQVIGPLPDRG